MPVTFIVEPNPGGHRFQYVGHVAAAAAKTGRVVVLTSTGARERAEFDNYLAHLPVELEEPFDGPLPPTGELARVIARRCSGEDDATVVVMDVDQMIKRWWLDAPRAFRGQRRPRVIVLFTRIPARLSLTDKLGWAYRISKTALTLLAFATRSVHRALYIAGRDDLATGWLLKRVRDPAICTAHADDRAAIRERLGLPADRNLVGILGGVNARKNVPLVLQAVTAAGPDVDLLLAGAVSDDVAQFLAALTPQQRQRVIVRDEFLSNEELDQHVAATDVVAIAQNNGPSGIMGKAVAAGVPVLTAGSKVRARECAALHAGLHTEFTADALAAGIRHLITAPAPGTRNQQLLPTGEEFAEVILGIRTQRA